MDDPSALNAADPAPPEPAVAQAAPPPAVEAPPLRRVLPIGVGLAVVGALLAWRAPDPGRGVGVRLRPGEVENAASGFLGQRGVDVSTWRLVVTARQEVLGRETRRYLLEHGGLGEVNRFAREVPAWQVRVFRPEEREGWQLSVDDAAARVVRFDHTLKEEAPGASLPEGEARAKAEAALSAAGFDVGKLVFKEAKSEKRPARLDHTFTWKDPSRSVAEAEYLVDVQVQGSAVDGLTRRFKLPEAWERAREKSTVVQYGHMAVIVVTLALLIIHGLLAFYRGVRTGLVPWRRVFWLTGAVALLMAAGLGVSYPLAWAHYDPAWPGALFRTSTLIGMAIVVLLASVAAVLALGAITSCFPAAAAALAGPGRRRVAGATAAAALAVVGTAFLLEGVAALALAAWPRAFPDAPVRIPSDVATVLPALTSLGGKLWSTLLVLAVVAVGVHFWRGLGKAWQKAALLAGVLFALVPTSADASLPEFLAALVQGAMVLGCAALLLRFVLGSNPAAYVLAAVWLGVLSAMLPLASQPGMLYASQGWVVIALAALGGAAWLTRDARRGPAG